MKNGRYEIFGSFFWYLNDQLHRENGPAAELANGTKEWWVNGERNREDGPAFECVDGHKEWWWHGKRHREDGPAVIAIDENNEPFYEWFTNGISLTGEEFQQWLDKKNLNEKLQATLQPKPIQKRSKI